MTESLPRAILFDLDDTILAYDAVAAPAWRAVCARFASRVPGRDAGRLYEVIREVAEWYWGDAERHRRGRQNLQAARAEFLQVALSRLGVEDPNLAAALSRAYTACRDEAIYPFPGAIETLDHLRAASVRLAVVTNGSAAAQRAKIERFGLAAYFDCIVVEGEFGVGKPDEGVYRHALRELAAAPADAWMVGDNLEWDVAAPQRLGLRGIWVDGRVAGLPADCGVQPDRIVRAVTELIVPAQETGPRAA